MNDKKVINQLTSKEWLQFSFSIWRDIRKTNDEKKLKHPAMFPTALCERLIRTFSSEGSKVLDPFNGVGSSMIGALNVGSKGIGIDLSKDYCEIAESRIGNSKDIKIINGDAKYVLSQLDGNSIDLCLTSPPYWNILTLKRSADHQEIKKYSEDEKDLGNIEGYDSFLHSLYKIFFEVYRVLKPKSYCVVNVMDIRKKSIFYPLHMDLVGQLKLIGFTFDDLIIWDRQNEYNNMRPLGYPYKFRINKVHEYLVVFYKE